MVASKPEVDESGNGEQRRRRGKTYVLGDVDCIGTGNCVGTFVSRLSTVSGGLELVSQLLYIEAA